MSAQGSEILGAITGEENIAATTSPLSLTTMATRALDIEGEVDWEGDNGSDPANSGRTSNTGPTSTDDLWSVNPTTTSGGISGAALTSGDRLFFGSADSTIRCLSTRNGSELWKTTVGGAISSSPILLNSIIYVGSEDSSLYAINLETGALLWKTAPDQLPIYTAPVLIPPLGLDASVNVYSVLLTSGKNVRALAIQDAADESVLTGDELWRYSVPWNIAAGSGRTPLFLRSTPAVNIKSGRAFFCTGKRQSVVAINLSNGTLIWEKGLLTNVRSSPAIDTYGERSRVYVTSDQGLFALGQKGGKKVWQFPAGASRSSPALSNDSSTIFFGSTDNAVYAVSDAGELAWSFATQSAITSSSPVLDAQGSLFIGSDAGLVYAINSSTGAQKWALQTNGSVTAAPVISRAGQLFVGGSDGSMVAVGAASVPGSIPSPSPPERPDEGPRDVRGPLNKTNLTDGALAAAVIFSILGGAAIIYIALLVMRHRSKESRDRERSATAAAWEMARLQSDPSTSAPDAPDAPDAAAGPAPSFAPAAGPNRAARTARPPRPATTV